jgi:hypothetical protein
MPRGFGSWFLHPNCLEILDEGTEFWLLVRMVDQRLFNVDIRPRSLRSMNSLSIDFLNLNVSSSLHG